MFSFRAQAGNGLFRALIAHFDICCSLRCGAVGALCTHIVHLRSLDRPFSYLTIFRDKILIFGFVKERESMDSRKSVLFVFAAALLIVACSHRETSAAGAGSESLTGTSAANQRQGEVTHSAPDTQETPTLTSIPTQTPTPTTTRLALGPGYNPGVNPLTGLKVEDPSTLATGPVLVSITNFPLSARPQSGLSFADHVWETSIGEGMTRYIAVFYGGYREALLEAETKLPEEYDRDYIIGPVRSGRVAFQEIKSLYPGGRLLIRYASQEVIKQLSGWILVRALDPNDINSAGLTLEDLSNLDLPQVDPERYAHLTFDSQTPVSGVPQDRFRITYNYLNNVGWEYDFASGKYLRSQDRADGSGDLYPVVDRLTGERIGFENVLLLWTNHSFENLQGTILEIDLVYLPDGYGFLWRDGRRYDVHWSTRSGELRIQDEQGQDFPLKPGRTIFEVVSQFSSWDEEQGVVRYVRPALPTLTPTPTPTITPSPSAPPTETP